MSGKYLFIGMADHFGPFIGYFLIENFYSRLCEPAHKNIQ